MGQTGRFERQRRPLWWVLIAVEFVSSAQQGDLLEMGLKATAFGHTSLTMRAEVRNMITRQRILRIEKIVFVSLDEDGVPTPHGHTTITYDRDRLPTKPPEAP